jgi:hypothetical protein
MAVAGHHLGIDFGTSHTVAMLAWPDGRVRPLLFDGSPLLPSAVYTEPDGRLLVGRDAVHAARVEPARFEGSPKRRIDDGTVLLGEREFTVPALIGAVLARVAEESRRVAGDMPAALTLTHPAQWGVSRRLLLIEAAQAAGLPQPRLVPEPVAAATYFTEVLGQRLAPGTGVVVYDFGAGTFDASVVGRGGTGLEVLAVDGIDDLGGLDLDALVVQYARSHVSTDWTRLDSPQTPEDRRNRRLLWEEARLAKEMLSRSESVTLQVPGGGDVLVPRTEFERVARPLLEQTVRTTAAVVRWSRLSPDQIAGVFLVGGSSRIPLVATLLHRELGTPPTVIEQPELVVAEGSLQEPRRTVAGSGGSAGATSTPVRVSPGPVSPAATAPTVQTPVTPVSAQPVSAYPVSARPVSVQPVSPQPVSSTYPVSAQPVSAQPVSARPVSAQPVSPQPVSPPPWRPAPQYPPRYPQQAPPPARAPRRRTGLAFVAGGLVTILFVLAVFLGRPLLDRLTAGGTQSPSGGPDATTPGTATPANKASATTTTAPPDQRKERPDWLPSGWKINVDLPATQLWHDQDEAEGGHCATRGDIMRVTRPDAGLVGCSIYDPLQPRFSDSAVEVEVTVSSGCAGLWTRTGSKGYFLTICRTTARFYLLGDEAPSPANQLANWTLPAEPQHLVVGVLASGNQFSVYAAGRRLGVVTDDTLHFGHVNAGGYTDGTESSIDVSFRRFRVWTP